MKIIGIVIAIILVGLAMVVWLSSRPISKKKAISDINQQIKKEMDKKKTISSGLVYIESKTYGIKEFVAQGKEDGKIVKADQPFHVASVGKAFTATLIGALVDSGDLTLQDPIVTYLDSEVLENLFVYEGIDYRKEVTVEFLLNHTSGVADYFEDEAEGADLMVDLVISQPEHFFTPLELVEYSSKYQSAVAKPGTGYHYSDTGYILLGMIIEEVSGMAFHECLHEWIFEPLQMTDSYLMFYSEPMNKARPIGDVWLNGVEVSDYKSLSVDWAGGGIISTLEDLAIFVKALNTGRIIEESTLESLYQFDYKFMRGIHYGNGFMAYHFKEFFPTLGGLPVLKGHMGILGTQMFYDDKTETTYICSFGSTDYSAGSVQTMIKVLATASRIRE